jgi:hypothetical protein
MLSQNLVPCFLLELTCPTYYSNYKLTCSSLIILNSGLGLVSYDEGVLRMVFLFSHLIIYKNLSLGVGDPCAGCCCHHRHHPRHIRDIRVGQGHQQEPQPSPPLPR